MTYSGRSSHQQRKTTMARWQDIAIDLRAAIARGDYPPGSLIPRESELIEQHQVSRTTIRRAVAQLTAEGLLQPVRRRGTVVRDRPPRQRITRTRKVYRDQIGYYFDPIAQGWRALSPPVIEWGPCPHDIAYLLGLEPGAEVLIRDRVMGDPETEIAYQLATSYIPADLAGGAPIAEQDTGPGGIYDRLEEIGHAPLNWNEAISARMPTPAEADLLDLAPGVPLLRIIRNTTSASGRPLEVNDTRLDSERFEVGYPISRDDSAQ
jgi:DNA-binding GntR family transcriptional regulator